MRLIVGLVLVTNLLDAARSSTLMPLYANDRLGGAAALGLLVAVMGGCALLGNVAFGFVAHGVPRLGPERARELTGDEHELRLITLPFRQHDELFYFQAAVRDRAIDALLGPFFDLVLIGVPVGLVAAMVAAWIIAGRAVAPMRRLSRAAQEVSPTRIGERFEVSTSDAEVARLAHELNAALARLEVGYRAQDQFIANVSHELKTPVAALLAQAQVAKMGERSLEKSYDFVDRSELLLKRLGKLVESFLVLARAGLTDGLPRESVSVIDLVLGCLHSCKEIGEQNHVHLVPRIAGQDDGAAELALHGDAELLLTMVENLVHNAITHSPEGGEVTIVAERQGDSVQIAVQDRGPGIPEEYRERIFDRFVQVPSSTRRGGSGLGLAIAKGIAVLHGGAIRVESHAGGGASFVVTLPVAGPEAETSTS